MHHYSELLDPLKRLVKAAGDQILSLYKDDFAGAQMEQFPVTQADLASESVLIDGLKQYPDCQILSEEQAEHSINRDSKYVFVIDPIDGTKDFVHKTGDFSVMLALLENSLPVIGIVYKPVSGDLYYAVKGQGAFLENLSDQYRLKVQPTSSLQDVVLLISRFHIADAELYLNKTLHFHSTLEMGSAGLKMCAVANGAAHLYINTSSHTGEWDSAPGMLIVQEAGGVVTDIDGNPLVFNKERPYNTNGFIVSDGSHHQDIVKHINEYLKSS
ncbi:hypothetical protein COW94_01745 [Candidatus Peregrinibacteria bacterium CG22_combo_CG10-13_8_21_14_all_44_10]|nr:MAG: hypothetical protein AUK45_03425 [Candidatus Peregrinibacteria bacterium CG2_30_44_17]PIP66440.1 MAG: hypothetical protein COW94_01745 [Candidatus Peregrinibacteria bacterium CG22_combo_CG10-13_8_21_14_all_44_10]PIS04469.1 MAG: hypothetical protein COT83_00405 [Candidatus Peregrinibacteria bacterium CG10_big_fil_rev_8_21_14_0_10_44_7]PJB89467.1 MAG: hypothetical protein CO082_00835 [Candidatus Peregrinibacteria bacterium CG_4_9_14_0_8_um_filter_44_15]